MYQAISAVYQQGAIVPLEPMALDENETVIVLRLRPMPSFSGKSLRGKYRDLMSPSEDFMRRKNEEKQIEDEKWPK
jgi:predicted DNA-binding antitoxin AbrB/MazE fold protein